MNSDIYFYIHIPYCYRKCPYCAFVSYEKQFKTTDEYTDILINEIKSFKTDKLVKTIYFGGGTPSILKPKQIEKILNTIHSNFKMNGKTETTLEINPISTKRQYLKELKNIGINRLSLGVQSFIDKKLKILGRLHNAETGINSAKDAQDIGFNNISIDIIYGLNEKESEIKYEMETACKLNIQHISTYMLSIEENTPFEKIVKNGQISISNDEKIADAYLFISDYLKNRGFEHYEISNFAKIGFKSTHNCSYWLGYDYRGFGVSANSFVNGIRFKNTDNLFNYINNENRVEIEKKLAKHERIKEAFVLMLRTSKGIEVKKFNKLYDVDIEKFYSDSLKIFIETGFIKKENGHIFLNGARAMIVSNSILSELI